MSIRAKVYSVWGDFLPPVIWRMTCTKYHMLFLQTQCSVFGQCAELPRSWDLHVYEYILFCMHIFFIHSIFNMVELSSVNVFCMFLMRNLLKPSIIKTAMIIIITTCLFIYI